MRISSRWLLFVSMLLGFAGCNNSATPPPIVIGHVSDKTRLDKAGDKAELGSRLALHDLTKDGALAETFGGRKIQVRHTDTRGEIDAFESEAVRLDSINRSIALLGGLSAREVAGLDHVKLPILTFHGQPVVGASSQVFYLGMSVTRQGAVLGEVVAQDGRVKRLAIVQDERSQSGSVLAEAFSKANPGATQVTLRFGKDVRWKELIERMKPTAQAIVFIGGVDDFNNWHRACRDAGQLKDTQVIYAGGDGDHRLFDVQPAESETILLATAFYADPASAKIQDFLRNFRQMPPQTEAKTPPEPDVHAALAYDSMRILVEAMKQTPTQVTPDEIRKELLKIKDFDGLTGPITITAERQAQRPIHVMSWQNGGLMLVKAFPP